MTPKRSRRSTRTHAHTRTHTQHATERRHGQHDDRAPIQRRHERGHRAHVRGFARFGGADNVVPQRARGRAHLLAPDFVHWIVGEKRWASLRPEAIHVMAAGSGGASRMTGTVVSKSYLGPVVRLLIDLNGTSLHASIPSTQEIPVEGDRVTLGFAKQALHLMEPV